MAIFALKRHLARFAGRFVGLNDQIRARCDRYVLAYHRVLPPEEAMDGFVQSAMWVRPQTFEAQIRWMKEVGEIVDYRRILAAERRRDCPLFAITFDDGWRDNYLYAWPILRKYNAPASIFLATRAMETGELFWPEDVLYKTHHALVAGAWKEVSSALGTTKSSCRTTLRDDDVLSAVETFVEHLKLQPEAKRKQRILDYFQCVGAPVEPLRGHLLTWEEVRSMQYAGLTFGSHSHSHRILQNESAELIEEEATLSKAILEARLGTGVDAFCYPNARYSGIEGAILNRCGYSYGFRIGNHSLRHCVDPYYVPRFLVYEDISTWHEFLQLRLLGVPYYKGT